MSQFLPVLLPTSETIAKAAAALQAGLLVAFPTETVYGLGGDATNDRAVAAIFALKGRPSFNPLIVHLPDLAAARALVEVDARAERLAARFWPGPLTLVLPRRNNCPVSLLTSAGLDSLAVRVPAHPVAQKLLRAAGRPLAAPSANRSGKLSPTTARHVLESFAADPGPLALVLDGGPCAVGVESTVVDLCGLAPALLRPGGVVAEDIAELVGPVEDSTRPGATAAPRSPGQLLSHYAPERPLRLEATTVAADEALLAFGAHPPSGAAAAENLSPIGDLTEAAANLFALLRRLDRPGISRIAVMPVPEHGLGRAINDRLRRAAAPRP